MPRQTGCFCCLRRYPDSLYTISSPHWGPYPFSWLSLVSKIQESKTLPSTRVNLIWKKIQNSDTESQCNTTNRQRLHTYHKYSASNLMQGSYSLHYWLPLATVLRGVALVQARNQQPNNKTTVSVWVMCLENVSSISHSVAGDVTGQCSCTSHQPPLGQSLN